LGLATSGLVSGLLYRTPAGASADRSIFAAVNGASLGPVADRAFMTFRLLGTAWAVLVVALGLAAQSLWLGISFGLAGLVAGMVERGIKALVGRRRPFEVELGARVLQMPPPADRSYPSADASRVWLFVAGLGVAAGWSPWAMGVTSAVAVVVSLGRVRLGVHYPLDVWAGACLGLGLGLVWASLLPR
jgi:undecaprenyl-diphosphatase